MPRCFRPASSDSACKQGMASVPWYGASHGPRPWTGSYEDGAIMEKFPLHDYSRIFWKGTRLLQQPYRLCLPRSSCETHKDLDTVQSSYKLDAGKAEQWWER